MYPTSARKWTAVVLVIFWSVLSSPAHAYAHGGGHGGGGYSGDGHYGGGSHYSGGGTYFRGGFHLSSGSRGTGVYQTGLPDPGAMPTHLVADSPGFPEDLPEARIHRFLQQHLPHPHLMHWLHG
jgi:hypothetical protein